VNQKYKASKLLHSSKSEDEHFIKNISITSKDNARLVAIRDRVRKALRDGFNDLSGQKIISEKYKHYLQMGFTSDQFETVIKLAPKFWTQGSFAYKTLNSPAKTPPQQIDIDDGIYFPMTFVEDEPVAVKELLFKLVDQILRDIAEQYGWELNTKKPTCSRLVIDEGIHMDIPIYAIPETKAEHLEKALVLREGNLSFESDAAVFDAVVLDPGEVYLAMRTEQHWTKSDPKKVKDWFEGECDLHPKMLRRVCRYLKAWRDHTWDNGGPSSICLMVAAAETFSNQIFNHPTEDGKTFVHDCQALLAVARALPTQLSGEIKNPAEDGEVMFPRGQTKEELDEIVRQANRFKASIEYALCYAKTKEEVVAYFQSVLGPRFPNNPDAVDTFVKADEIKAIPPITNSSAPATPANQRSAIKYRSA
tara:strand:- start:5068 stop:6327 length:1260 start_codon:yes stop_codon:yes gene_type:complete